jgi:hypothetical protein
MGGTYKRSLWVAHHSDPKLAEGEESLSTIHFFSQSVEQIDNLNNRLYLSIIVERKRYLPAGADCDIFVHLSYT